MKIKYYNYLLNFIVKSKRERVMFELQSKKEKFFSKMTNFFKYFNFKDIFLDLTHFEDTVAIKKIGETVSEKECFDLVNEKIDSLKNAYQRAVDSYMCNVLIIDERTIIYIGECEIGASQKYILKK